MTHIPFHDRCFTRLRLAALLLAYGLCWGCNSDLPGKPDPAHRPLLPTQITDFTTLVTQNCNGCHGAGGELGPAPPLNDPLFLAIVPDEVLVDVITHGRPGTPMPAFARHLGGTLTDEQIQIIAAGLKEHWSGEKPPQGPLPAYAPLGDPPAATGDAEHGRTIFALACAACHGPDGRGSGEDDAPGGVNNPAMLTLISDQAVRRIIITGRRDLGMPGYAGAAGRPPDFKPLNDEQIADLVALLAHWREAGAAGATSTAGVNP